MSNQSNSVIGNQSISVIGEQLDKIIDNQYYNPSNNSIDLLDDMFNEDFDEDDIGQAIPVHGDRKQKVSYWLLPFNVYF